MKYSFVSGKEINMYVCITSSFDEEYNVKFESLSWETGDTNSPQITQQCDKKYIFRINLSDIGYCPMNAGIKVGARFRVENQWPRGIATLKSPCVTEQII